MQCFEYEMLCLALEAEIRRCAPNVSIDRTTVGETLAENGIERFQDDTAHVLAPIAERITERLAEIPLAA